MTILGRHGHVIQVFNTTAPLDDKPLIVPRTYTLVADTVLQEDFLLGQSNHELPPFQSAFIDNPNAFPLWIYFPIADWTLRVSSNMQGTFPIYSPLPVAPQLTLKGGGGSVEILWCNFAQPYSAWTSV